MSAVVKPAVTVPSAPSRSPLIGELLLESGTLTEHDVARVMAAQLERGLRFGETAEILGLVSHGDIQHALAQQFDFPYVHGRQSPLSPLLFAAYEPACAQAEAFRSLRSQLLLRWVSEHRKTIAVLGARASAGCSVVAANLAIAFAQMGERTLLIDANLRVPRQRELFGIEQEEGLSEILGGRSASPEPLIEVESFNGHLAILCAGGSVPNPQELLSRHNFAYVTETLPAKFDIVIIDTPPMLDSADAQIIAARAGACLLVTRRHKTRLADIELAKQYLEPSGATLLGAVINE